MKAILRGGHYHRVYKPDWQDPLDTKPGIEHGGRWNAPRSFGVLYLNATLIVAAANARTHHAGRAIGLFDLKPERRPHLLTLEVPRSLALDAVTAEVGHSRCYPIGKLAYKEQRLRGIACRSAAECSPTEWLGEELAWFDRSPALQAISTQSFAAWYPDAQPA